MGPSCRFRRAMVVALLGVVVLAAPSLAVAHPLGLTARGEVASAVTPVTDVLFSTAAVQLTLVAPSGGTVYRNSTQPVTFSVSPAMTSGSFALWLKNTATNALTRITPVATPIAAVPAQTTYTVSWKATQAVGSYRLLVNYYAADGLTVLASAQSADPLLIALAPQPLDIAPAGGSVTRGSQQRVSWRMPSPGVASGGFALFLKNAATNALTRVTPVAGLIPAQATQTSYETTWTASQAAADYYLVVNYYASDRVTQLSSGQAAGAVTVLPYPAASEISPSSGSIARGSVQKVTWKMPATTGSGFCRLYLKNAATNALTLVTPTASPVTIVPGQASYETTWSVTQAAADYRLQVSYYAAGTSTVLSSTLSTGTVTVAPPPQPTLTAPADTAVLKGSPQTVTWSVPSPGASAGFYALFLKNAATSALTRLTPTTSLIPATAGQTSYESTWTATQTLGASYYLVVYYYAADRVSVLTTAQSANAYTLIAPTVTAPTGAVARGTTQSVTWTLPGSGTSAGSFRVALKNAATNGVTLVTSAANAVKATERRTSYSAPWPVTQALGSSYYLLVYYYAANGTTLLCTGQSAAPVTVAATSGPTHVSGTISSDTTWTSAGSPYIVDGAVSVEASVTLTLAPGTVVKFASSSSGGSGGLELMPGARLVAAGTAAAKVYLTSTLDDSVGGDTDGEAVDPAGKGWRGIGLRDRSSVELAYTVVRYSAGFGNRELIWYGPAGSSDGRPGPSCVFHHCEFAGNSGITSGGGGMGSWPYRFDLVQLDACSIHDNQGGISCPGGVTTLSCTDSVFRDNTETALSAIACGTATVSGCRFEGNGTALDFSQSWIAAIVFGNKIVGNGFGIRSGGYDPLVVAKNNWWGTDSGPEPWGTSNGISWHVEYDSWRRAYAVLDVDVDPWIGKSRAVMPNFGRVGWGEYAADPVNVTIGNYTYTASDVSIRTRGLPLEILRSYNSLMPQDSPFGYGWAFSYGQRLLVDEAAEVVVVVREDGRELTYADDGDGTFTPPAGVFDTLIQHADGSYALTSKEQTLFAFSRAGVLTSMRDRHGNETSLTYNPDGHLTAVCAPDGRTLTLAHDNAGHVTSVTDVLGRVWAYAYSAAGDLESVTDPMGGLTQYDYDVSHRLLSLTDANGHVVVTNTYDANGRVATQGDARGEATTYTYDLGTRTTYVRDALGGTTSYVYDAEHRVVSKTSPLGATTTTDYNDQNLKTKLTDASGHATRYAYDDRGNLVSTTNAAGDTAFATYNSTNDPLTRTDFIGYSWHFDYDSGGNLTRQTDQLGRSASFTYNNEGEALTSTDSLGRTTSYEWDVSGNLLSVLTPLGARTGYAYDAAGRCTAITDPTGEVWSNVYDANDRLTSTTDPLGNTTARAYDAVGNCIASTDAMGGTTRYAYDERNDVVKVTDALSAETGYTYDALRRLCCVTDANTDTTVYAYDADGRRTSATDPLGRAYSTEYDPAGNVTTITDAMGRTTRYSYDSLDHVTTVDKPGETEVSFTYDADGRKLTTTDARGTTIRSYDAMGHLIAVAAPDGKTISYEYDSVGERSSLTYPDGRQTHYTFDDDGRLISARGPSGDDTTYTYRTDGSLLNQVLPNGVNGSYDYDSAGRLTSIVWQKGTLTLLAIEYTRDASGNPTVIGDSRIGETDYAYDAAGRLISESTSSDSTVYGYDSVGHRLTKTVGGVTTSSTYDAAGELLTSGAASYVYDANGSRTSRSGGSGDATYGYNSDGLLDFLSYEGLSESYIYDGENRRVATLEGDKRTGFVLDEGTNPYAVLVETAGSSSVTYTYGLGLVSQETSGSVRYFLTDGLGSVRLVTDENGAVTADYAYDAFGNELSGQDPDAYRYRYTGQSAERGELTYLRARFYEPETGLFLSADPLSTAGGSTGVYSYCGNSPLSAVDPTGLMTWREYGRSVRNYNNDVELIQGLPAIDRAIGIDSAMMDIANGYIDQIEYVHRDPDPSRQAMRAIENFAGAVTTIAGGADPTGAIGQLRNHPFTDNAYSGQGGYLDTISAAGTYDGDIIGWLWGPEMNAFLGDSSGRRGASTLEPPHFQPYVIGKPFFYIGQK